jgi:hypothetical protein
MSMDTAAIDRLFDKRPPQVRVLYNHLLEALRQFGPVEEIAKERVIHLGTTRPFAEIQPRDYGFNLEFRVAYNLTEPRIFRQLQLSAHRFGHTVKIESESDIDGQLLAWLKDAYELSK